MATGPRPDDTYNPNQTVLPNVGAPQDYLSVHASPEDFGGQVGGALKEAGGQLQETSDKAYQYLIYKQGLMNEHAATQADMAGAIAGDQYYNEFKQLQGLSASAAKDQYIQKVVAANDQAAANLNPAARRAYEQLATRRLTFTIQNMNGYAADQEKKGLQDGNKASAQLSKNKMSQYEVATDPKQLGWEVGNVKVQAIDMFTNKQYGLFPNIPAKQLQDGTLQFDTSTEIGKVAQAQYDQYIQSELSEGYVGATNTINLKDGAVAASKFLDDHASQMSPLEVAKAKIQLKEPLKLAQTVDYANNGLHSLDADYDDKVIGDVKGKYDSGAIANAIYGHETSYGANVKTSSTGAKGPMQVEPDTWETAKSLGLVKDGEKIDDPVANKAVGDRLVDHYTKLYNGDVERVAVAYYSGPGNVAPEGSPHAWINNTDHDKHGNPVEPVSSYVNKVLQNLGGSSSIGSNTQPILQSKADYYDSHIEAIKKDVFDKTLADNPGRPDLADSAAQLFERRARDFVTSERRSAEVMGNDLGRYIDQAGQGSNPVQDIAQLYYDPKTAQEIREYATKNPFGIEQLKSVIAANRFGTPKTLGSDFPQLWNKIIDGDITNMNQLGLVGPDGFGLTSLGFKRLSQVYNAMQDPKQKAQMQEESHYLNQTYSQHVLNSQDSTGIDIFNKALPGILQRIDSGLSRGEKLSQMFDPNDKKNYILGDYKRRNTGQISKDLTSTMVTAGDFTKGLNTTTTVGTANNTTNAPFNPDNITSKEQLFDAVQKHQIDRPTFDRVAHKLKLAANEPPVQTPVPH